MGGALRLTVLLCALDGSCASDTPLPSMAGQGCRELLAPGFAGSPAALLACAPPAPPDLDRLKAGRRFRGAP